MDKNSHKCRVSTNITVKNKTEIRSPTFIKASVSASVCCGGNLSGFLAQKNEKSHR